MEETKQGAGKGGGEGAELITQRRHNLGSCWKEGEGGGESGCRREKDKEGRCRGSNGTKWGGLSYSQAREQ